MGEKKKKKGKKSDKNTIVTFADQYDDDELLRPFRSGVPPLDELPKKSNLKDKNAGPLRYVDHTGEERRAPTAKFVQKGSRAESPIDGIRMPYLTNTEHNEHQIRIGQTIPPVIVYENCAPPIPVNVRDLFVNARLGILFGLPGAFTPVCSTNHLPSFLKDHDKFKHRGVEIIACVTVNDPYVTTAWGYYQSANNKVKMLSDVLCEFTKSIGMETNMYAQLGGIRSKRFAMILENGVVKYLTVEDNPQKTSCTMAGHVLEALDNRYHDASEDHPLAAWYHHGKKFSLPLLGH